MASVNSKKKSNEKNIGNIYPKAGKLGHSVFYFFLWFFCWDGPIFGMIVIFQIASNWSLTVELEVFQAWLCFGGRIHNTSLAAEILVAGAAGGPGPGRGSEVLSSASDGRSLGRC